jgi:hypothetical protein
MRTITQLLLAIAVIGCAVRLAVPAAHSVRTVEVAEIVPASSFAVDNSLGYGTVGSACGYSLIANGITGYWSTVKQGTMNFIVFIFPAQQAVTQQVGVQITAPGGATVYTHAFAPQKISYEGTWFSVSATGDYSVPGTYTVSVYADNALIGQIPLVFTKVYVSLISKLEPAIAGRSFGNPGATAGTFRTEWCLTQQ